MTDLSPEALPPARLPQRRPPSPGPGPGLPQRPAQAPGQGPGADAAPSLLPRRTSAVRRVGRHRSLHRISVASDAPALILAVPGYGGDADAELAEHIAESAAESCPGVAIRIGYIDGGPDSLADLLAEAADPADPADPAEAGHPGASGEPGPEHQPDGYQSELAQGAPRAVVVPLLAGPHPVYDAAIAELVSRAPVPVMLATQLGPHPLLAGALHDRLSEVGLARASRARGLNIAAGANGIIVLADRGPLAVSAAGVTTVLLAARLAIPAVPASFGDMSSVASALDRLREAGATHPAIAPCVIGPESDLAQFLQLSEALGAPCSAPLGAHPAIAQLVAVRYGEALTRISVASH